MPGADLRVFIIWVQVKNAQSPAELATNAAREGVRYENARTSSYLDPQGHATKAFALPLNLEPRLGVQLPAWDVYLAYRADAKWPPSNAPPTPAFWMHQLSNAPKGLELDADKLREEVRKLLTNREAQAATRTRSFGRAALQRSRNDGKTRALQRWAYFSPQPMTSAAKASITPFCTRQLGSAALPRDLRRSPDHPMISSAGSHGYTHHRLLPRT